MLTPAPPAYPDVPLRLLALQADAVAAYVRHAAHPNRSGADAAHLKRWALAFETRAALAERNPAFAALLEPAASGTALATASGLPLLPVAVRWAVDEARPGTVTVTLDVAGPVVLTVAAPGETTPTRPVVSQVATRATCTFAAPTDGLYRVKLLAAGTTLAHLLIPITRAEFRLFREDSRALAFGFRSSAPTPGADYVARLARLAAAEAAARTNQEPLALALLASARAVPPAPTPTALFPLRPCR